MRLGVLFGFLSPQSQPGDLSQTKDILQRFAEAGFDDAVVLLRSGGPSPAEVRALIK